MITADDKTLLLIHCEDFDDSIVNNGVTIQEGKFENGFYFNGTKSYLELTGINLNQVLKNDFTLEFFINNTLRNQAYPTPLNISNGESVSQRSIYIHTTDSTTAFTFGNGTNSPCIISSDALTLNKWYHVALVRKDNVFKAFLDGDLVGESIIDNFYISESSKFYLGALTPSNTSTYFNGVIDEIRLSTVARWESDFIPPVSKYVEPPIINILSKTRKFVNFNVEGANVETVDIFVNNAKRQSFNSEFNSLKFNIDEKDFPYITGENIIKINVTCYDGYTCSKELVHKIHIDENASLKQVMDKFEEISLMDFSDIKIVAKTELPNKVKNGQIVCLSSYSDPKIIVSVEEPNLMNDGDIWVVSHGSTNFKGAELDVGTGNKIIKLYIKDIFQKNDGKNVRLAFYIGNNDAWEKINKELLIFMDGEYINPSITGNFQIQGQTTYSTLENPNWEGAITVTHVAGGYTPVLCMQTNQFDVTDFSELVIDFQFVKVAGYSMTETLMFGVYNGTGNNTNFTASETVTCSGTTSQQIKVDISKATGLQSIKARVNLKSDASAGQHVTFAYVKIFSIKLF